MTIEQLAKLKANSVPNFKLVKYYEAGIPQWRLETLLTMLKEKKISVVQEFILKFVDAGINDIKDIQTFLGLNSSSVNNAIAILQRENLVSVDIFDSKLRITDKGEDALKEALTIVPEEIECSLLVDGITGEVYIDKRRLFTGKDLKNFEIKAINSIVEKPNLNSLDFEDVKRAIVGFKKSHIYESDFLEGELQEIENITKAYVEYKKVSVLVFMNDDENEIEFHVYEGAYRNEEYSIEIQKQYHNNSNVVDFDFADVVPEEDNSLLSIVPKEIIDSAKAYSYQDTKLEHEILNLTSQLDAIADNEEEDDEQKESATEKIHFLENKIREMENERKNADRVLSTYDHRPLLIDSLQNASKMVVIVSPWIKSGGLNDEVIRLIEGALQRKTKIIIGYGISKKEDSDKWILNQLEGIQKKSYGKNLQLIRLSNTHEKVLIKDDDYMVITSFNWLSFKGDPQKSFRQETGYYITSKDAIKDMKTNLSNRMGVNL